MGDTRRIVAEAEGEEEEVILPLRRQSVSRRLLRFIDPGNLSNGPPFLLSFSLVSLAVSLSQSMVRVTFIHLR